VLNILFFVEHPVICEIFSLYFNHAAVICYQFILGSFCDEAHHLEALSLAYSVVHSYTSLTFVGMITAGICICMAAWVVMLCSLVCAYWCCRGSCCLRYWGLLVEAVASLTLVYFTGQAVSHIRKELSSCLLPMWLQITSVHTVQHNILYHVKLHHLRWFRILVSPKNFKLNCSIAVIHANSSCMFLHPGLNFTKCLYMTIIALKQFLETVG